MPLVRAILRDLDTINNNVDSHHESDYYGAWNMILTSVFRAAKFFVVPGYQPDNERMDFVVVRSGGNKEPILFVELKRHSIIDQHQERESADNQVRARFRQFEEGGHPIPIYAISAFGTRLKYYRYNESTNRILPLRDGANIDRWAYDILGDRGNGLLARLNNIKNE